MDTSARKRVLDAKSEWALVTGLLPKGWRDKARELGALRRARGITDAEMLLRALLVHLADGCSLKETALRVQLAGWGKISAVGLFKRLRAAERWLAWMSQQMHGRSWPAGGAYRPLAADATTVSESGKTGSLWRVHWSVDLTNLQCVFFELTDVRGGEKFARFPIRQGDLILADRVYCRQAGVEYVRTAGGHAMMRFSPSLLPTYHRKNGAKIDVLAHVRGLAVGKIRAWTAWVKGPGGGWYKGRVVAIRRSQAATVRELRRRCRAATSRQRHLGKRAKAMARYVMVWTSVPTADLSDRQVLRYYRRRWQLELVFKRAKSIMGLGQLPKKSDASSRAWLSGKLLVAMLVEKLWEMAESFSPWGYSIGRPSQPLA